LYLVTAQDWVDTGFMDIEAARNDLIGALNATARSDPPFRSAHAVLIEHGIAALQITSRPVVALDDIVRIAAEAPPTEARRAFAVLLVHALGVPGLLPTRGQAANNIRSFLERALLNPLRRAGYPFDGSPYDKHLALAQLHATIDEHLHPLQPSIPHWIHGLGPNDRD
jgi:hypothetical protein